MTRLGRKPQGAELVDLLSGSEHAKARLKAFLETLSGEASVEEVCQQLGICPSRFFEQRTAWLHDSIGLLEPRLPGRPRKAEPALSAEEAQALRQRVQELEARAAAVEVQADLVHTLPHVVAHAMASRSTAAVPKKTPSPAPGRRNRPK
jgi:transposase-like protein